MVLEVTFNVGDGVISFEDGTTQGSFQGDVVITHPDGFVSTVSIDDESPLGTVSFRTDSEGAILQGSYVVSYTNSDGVSEVNDIDFHYEAPTSNLECKLDYLCSKLTVTDKTSYNISGVSPSNTIVNRDLVISYPSSVGLPPVTSNTVVTVVSPIYTGTFGLVIETEVRWVFENYVILDVIRGDKECKVDEGDSLCSLICCMRESYKRWNDARCSNSRRASEFEDVFRRVTSIATLAYIGLSCGDVKGVEGYVSDAKKISGCGDCDCGDGTSGKLVVGLCGASTTGEVDVVGGDGITIGLGGVISVDESWLFSFVDNIILSLNIDGLKDQVEANASSIASLQGFLGELFNLYTVLNDGFQALSMNFSNHNILSFSYRFSWVNNVLTDNRSANNRILSPFVQRMNASNGWLDNPFVDWVNAASSNEPAELQFILSGFQSPNVAFENLNVVCTLIGRSSNVTSLLGEIKPVVFAISSGGENTLLRFKVRFWSDSVGYLSQSLVSSNTSVLGGNVHLSFFVTGKS